MIERHVYLRLKDRADRARVEERALAVLPTIPGVRDVLVGIPADEASDVWDVALTVRFAELTDVGTYLTHPIHVAFVAEELEPRVEVRKAWNFRVTGA
ncbi:MAG: Dabb family protein [Myxococcales bacterium]|nr:Dabb family protein [Myxococcales bacterium]